MSVTELKREVDALSDSERAELSVYLAQRESAEWDAQIDRDLGVGGRLQSVLDGVRADIRAGNLDTMP